jgi:hypothetical protein
MPDQFHGLNPAPFSGHPTENIVEFLGTFHTWTRLKRIDISSQAFALALLLQGPASQWYHVQTQKIREDITALKSALMDRYGPRPEVQWHNISSLWSLKQTPGQSLDDFITLVQSQGARCAVEEGQLVLIALNGLRPEIRSYLTAHKLTTIQDVLHWGRIQEAASVGTTTDTALIQTALREITDLTKEFKTWKMETSSSVPLLPLASQQGGYQTTTGDSSGPVLTSQGQHPSSSYTVQPQQDATNWRPKKKPNSRWRSSNGTSSSDCSYCGRKHDRPDQCLAAGKICYGCNKVGHFHRVCRSTRGRPSNSSRQ